MCKEYITHDHLPKLVVRDDAEEDDRVLLEDYSCLHVTMDF